MTNGNAYKFRHRSGRINWEDIGALNIDDITSNGRLGDLQGVLDNVTFSEITLRDIRQQQQEPSNILKLVQSMQLMLEYVLQGQEFQAALVKKMHAKYGPLKKKASRLETENVFLKEDIKVYKRQLAGLRSRLQTEGKDTDLPSDSSLEVQDSPLRNPLPPSSPVTGADDSSSAQKQEDDRSGANTDNDVRALVLDFINMHKGKDNKLEGMLSSLLSAIEQLQQQAHTANHKDSPLRKRVKNGHNNSCISSRSAGGDGVDSDVDKSHCLSLSSDGDTGPSTVVLSPLAYDENLSNNNIDNNHDDDDGKDDKLPKKPHTSVVTSAMIASAKAAQQDLKRQMDLIQAKRRQNLRNARRKLQKRWPKSI